MKCGAEITGGQQDCVSAPLLARITRARRQASITRAQELELTRLLHRLRASMVQRVHSIYLPLLLQLSAPLGHTLRTCTLQVLDPKTATKRLHVMQSICRQA